MTDRELLELAAKAAGILPLPDEKELDFAVDGSLMICGGGDLEYWNPLVDDADALRLAVRLHFAIDIGVMLTSIDGMQEGDKGIASEPHGEDPEAATRRAIVRAAADIGKAMT